MMSAPSLESEMKTTVHNDPVRVEKQRQSTNERCLEHEHTENSYDKDELEVTKNKNKLLFQSSQETTENEFVFIDTEEIDSTHEDDFTVVDLVSTAVPPEAQSHPELVESIISNPRHERHRSFPICLEEPTVNEICAQMTVVDDWLNIELKIITKASF